MIERVNFFSRREKGFSYQQMLILTFSMLVFLVIILSWQTYRTKHSTEQFSQLQNQIKIYQQSYGGTGLKKDQEFLWGVAGELFREPAWSQVLAAIANSLPDGIWLEVLEGKYEAEQKEIFITGTAYQPALVPKLLKQLNEYPVFSRVQLILTEVSGNIDAPFRFKIKAAL